MKKVNMTIEYIHNWVQCMTSIKFSSTWRFALGQMHHLSQDYVLHLFPHLEPPNNPYIVITSSTQRYDPDLVDNLNAIILEKKKAMQIARSLSSNWGDFDQMPYKVDRAFRALETVGDDHPIWNQN